MDDRAFAEQLAAWLDPYALVDCVRRYDRDSDGALTPATLMVSSGRFSSGDEGNYSDLVKKFLRGFKIPVQLVQLLRRFEPTATDESWNWLAEIRVSAEVQICSRTTVPDGYPPATILLVRERDAVVDVVRQPLLALLDLVDQLALHWRKVAMLPARIFHEPNMPTEFYSYVDRQVASAYLNLLDASQVKGMGGIKNRYRAVTVYGRIDVTNPTWEVSREAARHAAASTQRPVEP